MTSVHEIYQMVNKVLLLTPLKHDINLCINTNQGVHRAKTNIINGNLLHFV